MSHQFVRPATAFSVTRQRRERQHNANHLAFIRSLRCVICGATNPDPAHLRSPSPMHGKRHTGMAEKPDDKWTVPLCRQHHDEQHNHGDELAWWAGYGIDPFTLALSLHGVSGDEEAALDILRQSRPHHPELT